jgi:hypothetical protein
VAVIGGDEIAARNAVRIGTVMEGVRQLHRDVGRVVASAARQHLAGRRDGLDILEPSLGDAAAEIVAAELEGMSAWKVTEVFGSGTTSAGALNRPLSPSQASELFVREDS